MGPVLGRVVLIQGLKGKGFKGVLCVFLFTPDSRYVKSDVVFTGFPLFIILQFFKWLVGWENFGEFVAQRFGDVVDAFSFQPVFCMFLQSSIERVGRYSLHFLSLSENFFFSSFFQGL